MAIAKISNIGGETEISYSDELIQNVNITGTGNVTVTGLSNKSIYTLRNLYNASARWINSISGAQYSWGDGTTSKHQCVIFTPEADSVVINGTDLGGNLYKIADIE